MLKPLDLARYLVLPNRRLVVLICKVDIRANAVYRLFSIIESERIKLLRFFVYNNGDDFAKLTAFLDVTDSTVPPEEIGKASESLGLIKDVKIIKSSIDGFAVDTLSHPVVADSVRAVIFREPGYREMLVGIREWFGRNGEEFLYHIGFRTGLAFIRLHREAAERLGLKDPIKIYRYITPGFFQWGGFGVMEIQELDQDHGIIVVRDSFECELGRGGVVPYSQFVRGLIAGNLTELFGIRFNVVEEECLAKGDSACRFMIKSIPMKKNNSNSKKK